MKFFLVSLFAVAASVASVAARDGAYSPEVCLGGSEKYNSTEVEDGKTLIQGSCRLHPTLITRATTTTLTGQATDVCGAPCTTYCNGGTGGPNPNDCSTLASYLSGSITIPSGTAEYWAVGSCQGYVINTSSNEMYECLDSSENGLGAIFTYLAWNCQASTSGGPYRGGSCHFYDDTSLGWAEIESA